ncbi:MAG: hypothetical protein M5U28_51165 [Sandaracinaceae bacterium]|nr:hypothetical protein [Sandaracinaceae bacterium]
MQRCAHTTHAEAFPLIVEEALGAVLAPSMLHRVLEEALRSAELTSIPDQRGALRVFLEGALFSALIQHVAVPDALEMVAQVRSALELALASAPDDRPTSDVREKITLPAPPARVIVVTSASLVVFLLADELGDDIDVVPVSTEADLVDRLQRFAERPLLVVVDRRHPAVEASVAEELAGEARRAPLRGVVDRRRGRARVGPPAARGRSERGALPPRDGPGGPRPAVPAPHALVRSTGGAVARAARWRMLGA